MTSAVAISHEPTSLPPTVAGQTFARLESCVLPGAATGLAERIAALECARAEHGERLRNLERWCTELEEAQAQRVAQASVGEVMRRDPVLDAVLACRNEQVLRMEAEAEAAERRGYLRAVRELHEGMSLPIAVKRKLRAMAASVGEEL